MADMESLTPRQREIYTFIRSKIQGRGYGPTVREIGVNFHIKSPNGVMCHLKALQKKGLIHREPNMSRAIQLLEDSPTGHPTGLKMIGRIAAGQPIEAIEQHDELTFSDWTEQRRQVRPSRLGRLDDRRAHRRWRLRDHQAPGTGARRPDRRGARRRGRGHSQEALPREKPLRLEPANRTMKPIFRDHINILGILVGVVRKY